MRTINTLVLIYLGVFTFFIGYTQKKQERDYFKFEDEKLIKKLGVFIIDSFTDSKVIFDKIEGDITDKILYDDKKDEFNFNGTYKITHLKTSKSYYFKFGWQNYDTRSEFSQVNWLKNVPIEHGKYQIDIVEVPFVQIGNISICTIGDSQTWYSQGKYLRKFMNDLNSDYLFVGSNQDVFGYPHEGEGGNHTKDVLNRISEIPLADIYTVLLGTNDYKGDVNNAFDNLTFITRRLLEKNSNAIVFYITPLPTTDIKRDEFNRELKEKFLSINEKKIKVIYLGEYIRNYDNWNQFFSDGLHPNKLGYRIIATYLTLEINNWIQEGVLKN